MILLAAANPLSTAFTAIGLVLVICAAVGLAIAYTRSSLAKSTIELQSFEITAQAQRLATLDSEVKRAAEDRLTLLSEHESRLKELQDTYNKRVADLEQKITQLEASIRTLESLKTGSDAVSELGASMLKMHEQNQVKFSEIKTSLEVLKQDVR